MEIKRLSVEIIEKTRSSFTINSISQCVFELVSNSIDAKSTAIAIRLNLVTFRIQVVDNGEGISKENLSKIGERYMTSKSNSKTCNYHGFRGEALASIKNMCQVLNITSRLRDSVNTFSITHSNSNTNNLETSDITQLPINRPSVGTTVTINGFFHNLPVRKKCIVKEVEYDNIKKHLEALIIIYPKISFSLRDDITRELIINSEKSDDIIDSFRSIHPEINDQFVLLKIAKHKIILEALVHKEPNKNKNYQYIYVNRRPVQCLQLQTIICNGFWKGYNDVNSKIRHYAVYVIHVKCPFTYVDFLNINASKTNVVFKNFDLIERCINKMLNAYFGKENKTTKSAKVNENSVGSNTGIGHIKGAVEARGFKRKNNISVNKRTSENVHIEFSGENDAKPMAVRKQLFKKPLPIKVVAKQQEQLPQDNLTMNKSAISKFTNDELKGKDLIMDMFLKSTQVFKNANNDQQNISTETLFEEDNNYVIEQNLQDTVKGVNTTMSISVNVRKKIKTNTETRPKTLNRIRELEDVCFDKSSKENIDSYTVVLTNKRKEHFKFKRKQTDDKQPVIFNASFNKKCSCRTDDKFFNFKRIRSSDERLICSEIENNLNINKVPSLENVDLSPIKSQINDNQAAVPQPQLYHPLNVYYPVNYVPATTFIPYPYVFGQNQQHLYTHQMVYKSPYWNQEFNYQNHRNMPAIHKDRIATPKKQRDRLLNKSVVIDPALSMSRLVISLSQNEKNRMIAQEICEAKIRNEVIKADLDEDDNCIEQYESRIVFDSQNEWLRQRDLFGNVCYINKRTGMSTNTIPKLERKGVFDIQKRPDFVPIGLSPILVGHKPVDKCLSQGTKQKLHKFIMESYENELLVIKWENYIEDDPKQFFNELYLEKSRMFDSCAICCVKKPLYNDIVSFDKSLFKNVVVLGQLDRKFIVALDQITHLLVVFDQHAVHERIRVENLKRMYKNRKSICSEKMTFFIPQIDVLFLKNNQNYLDNLGLEVEYFSNGLHVSKIPTCLTYKSKVRDKSGSTIDLTEIIQSLLKEILEFLKVARRSTTSFIPKVIQNAINLEACRGAIKFGDILTKNNCKMLLNELFKCDLPFQCAHGRPTLAPLLKIDDYKNRKHCKVHLHKLKLEAFI